MQIKISEKCEPKLVQIRQALSPLLNPESSLVFSSVKSIRGDQVLQNYRNLTLNIDDFGSKKNFRGFFHHHNHQSQIWLDCSQGSILSWAGLLAHELVHFANRDWNYPSWLEEMLAQMAEARAQLRFPYERSEILRNSGVTPGFLNLEKPLQRQSDYATSLLFGFYLYQNFSGSEFFPQLQHRTESLEDLSDHLVSFTSNRGQFDWLKGRLGARDLIRNFALAMSINLPMRNHGSLYQVPGWSGFTQDSIISKPGTYFLEPSGFMRVQSVLINPKKLIEHHDLAAYKILKLNNQFQILSIDDPIAGLWKDNFILIINLSTTQSYEFNLLK